MGSTPSKYDAGKEDPGLLDMLTSDSLLKACFEDVPSVLDEVSEETLDAGLGLVGNVMDTVLRESIRPSPDEVLNNPVKSMAYVLAGGDPMEIMVPALKEAAISHNQGQRSTNGGPSKQMAASTESSKQQSAAKSLPNSTVAKKKTRRRSFHEPDPSSDTKFNMDDVRTLAYHFVRRLTRYVRLSGIGQYISEQTNIRRSEIFLPFRSEFQDRSSHLAEHHAAHIVRAQVNATLETDYPALFVPVRNFLGRTHLIPKYGNVYNGVGGDIDRIQAEFLKEMSTIDFRGDLTAQARDILKRLVTKFLNVFIDAVRCKLHDDLDALEQVIKEIGQISIEQLFEKGQKGLEHLNKDDSDDDDQI